MRRSNPARTAEAPCEAKTGLGRPLRLSAYVEGVTCAPPDRGARKIASANRIASLESADGGSVLERGASAPARFCRTSITYQQCRGAIGLSRKWRWSASRCRGKLHRRCAEGPPASRSTAGGSVLAPLDAGPLRSCIANRIEHRPLPVRCIRTSPKPARNSVIVSGTVSRSGSSAAAAEGRARSPSRRQSLSLYGGSHHNLMLGLFGGRTRVRT